MRYRSLLLSFILTLFALTGSAQDEEEAQLLNLINQHRASSDACWDGGWFAWPSRAQMLVYSEALSNAARAHNQAMLMLDCFAHVCPGEAGVGERITAAGYTGWRFLAENIAAGMSTAELAFDIWRNSEGHNLNMLHCRVRAIGIARAFDEESTLGWVWTTDFGDVIEVTEPTPAAPPPTPQPTIGPSPNPTCFRLDANDDNRVGDAEVLSVIELWITGNPICQS